MSSFLVYVETNWLVGCLLPHDERQSSGLALLAAAEQGDCALKIPLVAVLEARHVIARETETHSEAVARIADSLTNAAKNRNDRALQDLAKRVRAAEESYRLRDPLAEYRTLQRRCAPFIFSDPLRECVELDRLSPDVKLTGKDIVDLYIIAAIAADRTQALLPGAFLSTNTKQFAPKKGQLPPDFYEARKLIYSDSFDLRAAQKQWTSKYGPPPSP